MCLSKHPLLKSGQDPPNRGQGTAKLESNRPLCAQKDGRERDGMKGMMAVRNGRVTVWFAAFVASSRGNWVSAHGRVWVPTASPSPPLRNTRKMRGVEKRKGRASEL